MSSPVQPNVLSETELVRRARSVRRGDVPGRSDWNGSSASSRGLFPSRLRGAPIAIRRHVEAGARRSVAHWKVLVLGQILSVLRFVVGASATLLYRKCGLSAPATQTGVSYYLLLIFHGTCFFFPRVFGRFSGGKGKNEKGSAGSRDQPVGNGGDFATSDDDVDKSRRGWFPVPLHAPLRNYFLVAFLHVEGNYLFFLSLRFTTFTSVTLFANLAVPAAMVFSRLLLRRRYGIAHLLGVAVCLVGVALNVYVDYKEQRLHMAETGADDADSEDEFGEAAVEEYPRRLLGDALAIVGGLMLGMNDVLFERAVRTYGGGPREFLPMLGLFGAVISTIQVLLVELPDLAQFSPKREPTPGFQSIATKAVEGAPIITPSMSQEPTACTFSQSISLFLAGCSLSMYLLVAGVSHFLTASESALLNLSYLTEDWWSVIFSVVAVGYIPRPMFYLALVLVLFGVFLYETGPSPADPEVGHGEEELLQLDDGLAEVAAGRFTGEGPKDVEVSSGEGSSSFGDEGSEPSEKDIPDIT